MTDQTVEKPAPAKAAKAVEVPITVLTSTERVCLVQWFDAKGNEQRCQLPADAVRGKTLPADVLAQGVPYGIPWAQVLKPAMTVERLEQSLHAAGLWTLEDVQMYPDRALSALQSAYGTDLGQLLTAASDYSKKEG